MEQTTINFEGLYRLTYGGILAKAIRLAGKYRMKAEDWAAETVFYMMECYSKNKDRFPADKQYDFIAYIGWCVNKKLLSIYRREKNRYRIIQEYYNMSMEAGTNFCSEVECRLTYHKLRSMVPDKEKDFMDRSYELPEESDAEIGRDMGVSKATVSRIRSNLREICHTER